VDELTVLALDAAEGSQESLADVIRRTQSDVWRLCAHLVDQQSANDLTQETYERAVRQLRRFRGDGPVRSWLLTIARRVCAAEVSARQRERGAAQELRAERRPAAGDPTHQVELSLLLEALEPDRRAAFVLTQMLGFSYEETARICECPIGTVRSRVARARDDLIKLS
jgi:RNA polymerase sigma-70 factor (ECF subfamily)